MGAKAIRIDELTFLSCRYADFPCKPNCKKYKEGTIFDEDKSLKWNREEVVKKNLFMMKLKKLNRKKNQMYTELVHIIKQYIIQETNVT